MLAEELTKPKAKSESRGDEQRHVRRKGKRPNAFLGLFPHQVSAEIALPTFLSRHLMEVFFFSLFQILLYY